MVLLDPEDRRCRRGQPQSLQAVWFPWADNQAVFAAGHCHQLVAAGSRESAHPEGVWSVQIRYQSRVAVPSSDHLLLLW